MGMLDYYNNKNDTNRTPSQQAGDEIKAGGGMLNYYSNLSEEEKKKRIQAQAPKPTTKPSITPTSNPTSQPKKQEQQGGFNLNSLVETIKKAVISAIPQLAPKVNIPKFEPATSPLGTPTGLIKTLDSSTTGQQPLSATLTPQAQVSPTMQSFNKLADNIVDNELRKKKYEPIIATQYDKPIQSKGTLNWTDKVQEIADRPDKLVPFLSSASEAKDLVGLLAAANRYQEGKATSEDMKLIRDFKMKESQDKTFGYKVLDVVSQIPAFAGELAATGGIATVGKKGATKGIKYLLSKVGKELVEKDMQKLGFKIAVGVAGQTLRTPAAGATRIVANTLSKQVQTTLTEKDKANREDFTKSAIKAFGEQWVETLSEFSGGVLSTKYLPAPIRNKILSSALFKAFQKINPGKNSQAITKLFNEIGYNGMLAEMFEERVADIGNAILEKVGLSDQKFKLPSGDQLLVEAVSFSVPGIAGQAISRLSPEITVMTPQQAKTQAEGTDLKGTPAGEAIAQATQQAESEGKNIKIEIVESKEGAITTPGGTNIKVSVVEDKAPIQQFTVEKLKKMTPEEKQVIVDERQKQSFIKDDTEQPKALRIGGQYATLTPEQSVALRNEVGLIPGAVNQLHLNLESKAVGANETKVDLNTLAEQYFDVKKALDNAGIKIEQPSTPQGGVETKVQPKLTPAEEYVKSKKTKFRSSLKLPSLSEEVKSKLNKIAIKEYGLTNYNKSVGYITPEGKGIDSSGIRQGSGSQGRNIDHREIAEAALGDNSLENQTDSMNLFMKETGNIRVVSAVNDMNIEIPIDNGIPTKKQIDKLRQMTGDMKVFYDISVNGNYVNTGEAQNFNDFYKDLVDTVKSEEKIKESIKSGNIPENLKELSNIAKKSETFESFMESLFTEKGRAITNKAFVYGEKVYSDYGYKNGEDFYNKVKKQELFRIKDDFKRATGITITNSQEAEIIKLNKEIFGDEDIKITEQILSNNQALGSYNERMIKILGGQADAKDTFYHESVHKYLDVALSEQEHVDMLEEAAKQYGIDDFSQVEERVAEDFITYAKTREGVVGKLKLIFDKLLLRINKFLKNRNRIDELYNDILTGQAKKILATEPKTIEETRQIMEEYSLLIEEGTQELNAQLAENERITTELRGLSGDNLKDIATIKRMANTKEGQEGDIETLYKKSPVLTSRVVNAIMTARKDYDLNTNMTDEQALLIALSLPAKKDIRVGTNEKIKQANRLAKDSGIKITEDYTTEQSFSDFERQFNEANQDLPGAVGESKLTNAAASRIYQNIGRLKSVEKKIKASQVSATEQTPVGTGTEQKSAAYERIKERLTQEVEKDVNYNQLNLEQDVQNALTFITNSPQAALRVGLGLEQPPAGQTETSISIALADKAFRDGDIKLMARLESSRSRRQTRRGQEIVAEKGRFNENSPHTFIKEVMDRRLKDLGSNLEGALARVKGRAKSVKEAAILQIDENVAKIKRKINIERYKIKSAQEIIDSLICK